jgi:hypothetical protein
MTAAVALSPILDIGHLGHRSSSSCRPPSITRFLVASRSVRDLLLSAKHLFVEAIRRWGTSPSIMKPKAPGGGSENFDPPRFAGALPFLRDSRANFSGPR